jgi:2,3-bisphosphoglycerate-independent phosphoglycerate mutase
VGRKASIKPNGRLSDIAPTLLYLMGEKQPSEMTGQNLIQLND